MVPQLQGALVGLEWRTLGELGFFLRIASGEARGWPVNPAGLQEPIYNLLSFRAHILLT